MTVLRLMARRILIAVPIIFGVTIINFGLLSAAPGSPVDALVNPLAGAEVRHQQEIQLGLDKPVYLQYLHWLVQALHGNLGYSYQNFQPVTSVIADHVAPTAVLVGTAFVIAFLIGIAIGVLSSVRQYSIADMMTTFTSVLGISTPGFFLGLVLIYVFSLKLGLFPTGGMLTTGAGFSLGDLVWHMVLPVVALVVFDLAGVARYARAGMLEVLSRDYIRTANGKGLSSRLVLFRHALRNGLTPVVTLAGVSLPRLFGGAVVIEVIFQWQGIGQLTLSSILSRDYPTLMGINLVFAILVIVGSLAADLLYAVINPRVRAS